MPAVRTAGPQPSVPGRRVRERQTWSGPASVPAQAAAGAALFAQGAGNLAAKLPGSQTRRKGSEIEAYV